MLDTALYEEPQFEVLIEEEALHCRATGVFGVPAPLRGLVDTTTTYLYPTLISNQTTHDASVVDGCKPRLGPSQMGARRMRQVSFTQGAWNRLQ